MKRLRSDADSVEPSQTTSGLATILKSFLPSTSLVVWVLTRAPYFS